MCQRYCQVSRVVTYAILDDLFFIRIQAQFDHIAETYFAGFDHDLGERELGYAMTLDHELDMFAASIGLTKTSITGIAQDEGEVVRLFGNSYLRNPRCCDGAWWIRY
jgi:hypothetical protein